MPPGVITYIAFLTGMLENYVIDESHNANEDDTEVQDAYFNSHVDKAIEIWTDQMYAPML